MNFFRDPNQFFPPTVTPDVSKDDKDLSVDVFTVDEDNLCGLAYWDFKKMKWEFHTDMLSDPFEEGNETKWVWFYPPKFENLPKF